LRSGRNARFQGLLALVHLEEDPKVYDQCADSKAIVQGVMQRAKALGYLLEVVVGRDFGGDTAALVQSLRARGVDGVLMPHMAYPRVPMNRLSLLWAAFPCICFGGKPYELNAHFVSNDEYATTYEATARAHRAGRKRIGMAINWRNDATTENRLSGGYLSYCLNNHLTPLPMFGFQSHAPELFRQWLTEANPDCIMTSGNLVQIILAREGRKVPEEIALVSLSVENTPLWAGMRQHSGKIGEAAVDMLVGQIHHGERGPVEAPRELLIRGIWTDGATLPDNTAPIRK
jgi:DNA-binding LacI/PurR family transcriptional regulator